MSLVEHYRSWHLMAEGALESKVEGSRPSRFRAIAFTGMGGSGIVGDYVKSILEEDVNKPIVVVRDIAPPLWIKRGWLVVAISYSGNTLETIRMVEEALARGAQVAVVSSGGRLFKLAEDKDLLRVKLEVGYAPRSALPLMLFACLKLMEELRLKASRSQLEEGLRILKDVEGAQAEGEALANELVGYTPIVISDVRYEALAWRFKSELNENAKIIAKCEVVPESMHNDLEGYRGEVYSFKPLILSSGDDTFYTRVLESFLKEALERRGLKPTILKLKGGSRLAKLIYGSHVAGFTSISLAKKRKVDPLNLEFIVKYREYVQKTPP